jgi:hypothetical protein
VVTPNDADVQFVKIDRVATMVVDAVASANHSSAMRSILRTPSS